MPTDSNKYSHCKQCGYYFGFIVQYNPEKNICPSCISIDDCSKESIYNIHEISLNTRVFHGRIDLHKSGYGGQITIAIYPNGKVAVGLDRWGFFVFASSESFKHWKYVAEKLNCHDDDVMSKELVEFFEKFFKSIKENENNES